MNPFDGIVFPIHCAMTYTYVADCLTLMYGVGMVPVYDPRTDGAVLVPVALVN